MNYKDSLRFITNCLSLRLNAICKEEIRDSIISGLVDWDKVVDVSSNHLVLPALFIQLKLANLLDLLPSDLQDYMSHITALNRIRNQHNLEQVKELNEIFRSHQIKVIYLKGTAHLLDGLYNDISERMVGDIDLLVDPMKMELVAKLLADNGYKPMSTYDSENFDRTKHYPRMIHKDKVFAVEIHKDVIQNKSDRQLDYKWINTSKRRVNNCYLPSYKDLILHNIMNTQLNDQGFLCMNINLRQKYDLVLLSQYEKPYEVVQNFSFHKLKSISYLVKVAGVFTKVNSLRYQNTVWTRWVELMVYFKLNFPMLMRIFTRFNFVIYRIYRDVSLAIEFLPDKNKRNRILKYLFQIEHRKIYFQSFFDRIKSI
jgi:hypothetical protein